MSRRTSHIDDLPPVITIEQMCGVFQISERQFRQLRAHGAWKIPEIDGLKNRFSKALVQRFIENNGQMDLRVVKRPS